MNLSHPEQYFAPVLPIMESSGRLQLHNEGDTFDGIPKNIDYPCNVAFIGTVNMDETTHGTTDKVLDRAFTMGFWDINLQDYPSWQTRIST
jgi:5-methylcytosine-specific restriction endonuclease McrBC GTP-binding regulatory subunit McrB